MKNKNKVIFESIDEINTEPNKFKNYYIKLHNVCGDLPYDFRKRLRYLRESMGYTREKLEEKSNISAQTIKQIEINFERGYTISTILALCIGMNLPPELSFELIRKSGYNIETNSSICNCVYCYLLRNMYNCSIDDVNNFLIIIGMDPLTNDNSKI